MDSVTRLKQQAADAALDVVSSGTVVGLGTGSTAVWMVRGLAARLKDGRLVDVRGIPTSTATEAEARRLGIPLTTLEANPVVDVTIDGADEVDGNFNLIKGGGGALLREKIVAQASRRVVIVADDAKWSDRIGTRWAVPVEVVSFGWRTQKEYLEAMGAQVRLRVNGAGKPVETDSGHLILDCRFGPIDHPGDLAGRIKARTGVVDHGLFIGIAGDLVIAGAGGVRHLKAGIA
jgi:ribose 5-phosphate isomerase A